MIVEEDLEKIHKVIVVGNGRVGKTTIIARFAKGQFLEDYKKTLGVAFLEKNEYVSSIGQDITFHLWDTAGQEEFDALTREYYKGASGCVLAFSPMDKDSFDAVKSWQAKVIAECGLIPTILIQTKSDIASTGAISDGQASALAEELKLKIFRTSSKENKNVKEAFHALAEMVEKYNASGNKQAGVGPVMNIGEIARKSKKGAGREQVVIKTSDSDINSNMQQHQQQLHQSQDSQSRPYNGPKTNPKEDCNIF